MLLTTVRLESALRRLDRLIASVEPHASQLHADEWRQFLALKQRRHNLRLILVARRIECRKPIVSLHRWRYGFAAA